MAYLIRLLFRVLLSQFLAQCDRFCKEQGLLLQDSQQRVLINYSGILAAKHSLLGKVSMKIFSFIMRFSGESFHIHIHIVEPQKCYVLILTLFRCQIKKHLS